MVGVGSFFCSRFGSLAPSFPEMSINWLELMAIKLSLDHFAPLLQGQCFLLLSDKTSVACIERQGTYRSDALMSLSRDVLEFCQRHSITLVPRHLCGELNALANQQSHSGLVGRNGPWTSRLSIGCLVWWDPLERALYCHEG